MPSVSHLPSISKIIQLIRSKSITLTYVNQQQPLNVLIKFNMKITWIPNQPWTNTPINRVPSTFPFYFLTSSVTFTDILLISTTLFFR